ncbi:hypothetical protein DVV91_11755 [Clostridium botulinum]|uniref:hypothetical protein n=1 Tax=Clostridium botulinum TaxID=1491 RepID=UPI0019683C3A|nr:hypothetical protein [Clostridium botulinum]MBN1075016.1 hypothetical protein [Clostridium botulinum]
MKIKFPTRYNITYPDKNLKYYSSYSQPKIKKLLTNSSTGYCMYCGNKILINNRNSGQIEHSIEKKQRDIKIEYLTHCKYNMAIACAPCNVKFKKNNILPIDVEKDYKCAKTCNDVCSEYRKNYSAHCKINKIILLPHGVENPVTNESYEIDYDLLKLLFIPSNDKSYTIDDIDYIQSHIDRFALNSSEFMPTEVLKVCEYFLKTNDIPTKGDYTNIIADKFIEYLGKIKDISLKNAIKVCELILLNSSL